MLEERTYKAWILGDFGKLCAHVLFQLLACLQGHGAHCPCAWHGSIRVRPGSNRAHSPVSSAASTCLACSQCIFLDHRLLMHGQSIHDQVQRFLAPIWLTSKRISMAEPQREVTHAPVCSSCILHNCSCSSGFSSRALFSAAAEPQYNINGGSDERRAGVGWALPAA